MSTSLSVPFSIYRRIRLLHAGNGRTFLQPGNKQVAAGYVVYGSTTMLVYTTRTRCSRLYLRSFAGVFCLCQERMRFPEKAKPTPSTKETTLSFRTG
ncbi:hypothetical protein ACLK19_28575 [Escherichia coli]